MAKHRECCMASRPGDEDLDLIPHNKERAGESSQKDIPRVHAELCGDTAEHQENTRMSSLYATM